MTRVTALLDRDGLRVVTLLGPGGVGKTRLALEVAHRIGMQYADGVVFVPLESVGDPALVPDAIARALDIPSQPGRHMKELLADVLAPSHLLLVLDNCEHVVGAASWLESLLARCPRLGMLATSRRPLQLAGEQRMPVAPLPVPTLEGSSTSAVDLFIERALAANPDLVLDGPTLEAIAEICRQLDGLPLAIELAAARVTVLSPPSLLARLADRLALLTAGRSDAPRHLHSLRESIDWSYDLLDADAQRALRRASAFPGGFSLEAARFALAWPEQPFDEGATLDIVQTLVEHNLVQAIPGSREPRFRMLETIREYGQEQACRRGKSDEDMGAFAAFFVNLASKAERELTGSDQAQWLERLGAEYPNILAAIDWLDDQHRVGDSIAIICAIQWFLAVRGHLVNAQAHLERWCRLPALAEIDRARVLHALGCVKQATGELRLSGAMLREASERYRTLGDRYHESVALSTLVATHYMKGDLKQLSDDAPTALVLAIRVGDHRGASSNLHYLAACAEFRGDPLAARSREEQALRIALEHGDAWTVAVHVRGQAWRAASDGQLDEAERLAVEARELFESLGSRREVLGCWSQLAKIALARDDYDTAAARNAVALAVAVACGYDWWTSAMLTASGRIETARGEFDAASEALAQVLRYLDDPLEQWLDTAACLNGFALLAAKAGKRDQATRFRAASMRLTREAGIDPALPATDLEDVWLERELRESLSRAEMRRALSDSATIDVEAVVAEARNFTVSARRAAPTRPRGLSSREMQVLQLMANGYSNQQIADELYLALRTVTSHVTAILAKLEVPSRTAAVSLAIRERWT